MQVRISQEVERQAKIVPLQTLKRSKQQRHSHLGALLLEKRKEAGSSQQELADAFEHYRSRKVLSELGISWPPHLVERFTVIKPLTVKEYSKIELNRRSLWFNWLLPLYVAMTAGCGLHMTPEDRREFLDLARHKIENKKGQYRERLTDNDWQWLEEQLRNVDGNDEEDAGEEWTHVLETDGNQAQRAREHKAKIQAALTADTSHILGREQWLEQMLTYVEPQTIPRKKIVVIQAELGAGKTSCLKLLQKRLFQGTGEGADDVRILYHECKKAGDLEGSQKEKSPAEHLEALLAHIINDLQPAMAERREAPSIKERIRLALQVLSESLTRLVLLIDDAQALLEQDGELSPIFQQFLDGIIEHNHRATLFLATRAWPGWSERKDSYLVQTELEMLSPETCAEIWGQLGYSHEREETLRQAAELCGYNPRMIEIVARHLDKPVHAFGWSSWQEGATGTSADQGLACFVKDPHTLSQAMIDAFPLIDDIVTTRLSSDARQLLTILALSPLPLPAPLLTLFCQRPQRSVKELMRVSLLAHDPARLRLLPLVTESVLQQLSQDERSTFEELLIAAYRQWMDEGNFRDEREQAMVVAELAILHLKHCQFVEAAELSIGYGWLLYAVGHARRIARIASVFVRSFQFNLSETNELGSLLLRLRFKRFFKDWTDDQRKQAYLQLYEAMARSQTPRFKPKITIYIIHHQLRSLVEQKKYEEAYALAKDKCGLYKDLQDKDRIAYIELLDRQAYVAGRWGDYLASKGEQEKAFRLRQEAVDIHRQCINQLRSYEYFVPPLLQSHILYQKARMLHDLSFYERVLGDDKAMIHIEECLSIKEAGYTVPASLAITYDDYAHLLAKQGKYQQALHYSDLALQHTQRMVESKISAAPSQKGMLLVNRGKLLLQLKRFEDAQVHFAVGKSLVEGTSRHDLSFPAAEAGLRSIEEQRRTNPRGLLDHQWFVQYQALASYSDVRWLSPVGPLTPAEQQEWMSLRSKEDEMAKDRLSEIIALSQERELTISFNERREPQFHYPLVALLEIEEKIAGLLKLQSEINDYEENIVVRQFYLDAITERINELEMIAAAGKQDDEVFWAYSQRLYTLPKNNELELAIRPLALLLRRGLRNSSTSDLALQIIRQTQKWSIDPMTLEETAQEQEFEEQLSTTANMRKYFSSETVQRFFEDVFLRYQFSWRVVQESSASHPRISLSDKELVLPKNNQISSTKIREILSHEIEMHAFRSVAGERSRLQLLSLGLANFLETEEGLAIYYSMEAARFGATKPNKTWIGTLAIGLASGLICSPLSFHELRSFLIDVFTLRDSLATTRKTKDEIQEMALRNSQKRCLRTFRGVSHFSVPGICALKDGVYLRGYLAVCDRLQQEPSAFSRLLVGSVGSQHLDMLRELDIMKPHTDHQMLACNSDLESYIAQFSE
jgi:hypothetical protein